jgi:putative phosphoesterase
MGARIKARSRTRPLRVGVISDTHGVLHPEIGRVFARVDHILHAGDVGDVGVLEQLRQLAPVTAIRGNADPPTVRLPACRRVDLGGVRVLLVHHGLAPGGRTTTELERGLRRYRPAIVVFGHSHMPLVEWRDSVLLVNPGGGGRRRFRLPRSVALMSIGARGVRARVVVLDRPAT